jgi:hypothetical protein
MIFYNSALKHINSNIETTSCNFYKQNNNIVLHNDLLKNNLPEHFNVCDFLYTETPYPLGFKSFNKNKNKLNNKTYNDLADSLKKIINLKKPIYLTLGKTLLNKLPISNGQKNIKQNNDNVIIAWWNTHQKPQGNTSREICKNFNYKCMGDFMCGYGQSVIDFNKNFVASDFDKNCVGVVKQRLQGKL